MITDIFNKYQIEPKTLVDILIFSGIKIKNVYIKNIKYYDISLDGLTIIIDLYKESSEIQILWKPYISIYIWKNSIQKDSYTCECILCDNDKSLSSLVFTKQSFINTERNYKIDFLLK